MFRTLITVLDYADKNNWSEEMLSVVLNAWPDANQLYLELCES